MRRIFWGFCRNWFLIDTLHYLSSRWFWLRIRGDIRIIKKRLPDSASCRGESRSHYSNFFKFIIDFPNIKRLNQPFKRSVWLKRSQGCNVLSPLIYLKVWKKLYLQAILLTPRLGELGSGFTNNSANSKPKLERLERSVRDLCRTGLCKNPRKSVSLPCHFKIEF